MPSTLTRLASSGRSQSPTSPAQWKTRSAPLTASSSAGRVAEIALDELHPGLVQLPTAPAGWRTRTRTLWPSLHQRIHQPAADETGGPGDEAEHAHAPPVAVRRSSSVRIRALSTEISDRAIPGSACSSRWKSHLASSAHSVGASGDDRGRPGQVVDHAHLAEEAARPFLDDVDPVVARRSAGRSGPPRQHDVERHAGVALPDDDVAGRVAAAAEVLRQPGALAGVRGAGTSGSRPAPLRPPGVASRTRASTGSTRYSLDHRQLLPEAHVGAQVRDLHLGLGGAGRHPLLAQGGERTGGHLS